MSGYTPVSPSSQVNSAGEIYDSNNGVALILRDGPHKLLSTGDVLATPNAMQPDSQKLSELQNMDNAVNLNQI